MTTEALPTDTPAPRRLLPDRVVRRDSAAVGLATGLLFTAVALATGYSRGAVDEVSDPDIIGGGLVPGAEGAEPTNDLDWTMYGIGLAATATLIILGAAVFVLVKDRERRYAVAGWPLAFGNVGVGAMIAVGLDDADLAPWVVGGVVAGVGIVGYLLVRRPALAVTALGGLAVVYGKVVDEFAGDLVDFGSDNEIIEAAVIVVAFAVFATALSWLTPHRELLGVVVGAVLVGALVLVVAFVGIGSALSRAFSFDEEPGGDPLEPYHNDMWLLLAICGGLVVAWAVAHFFTNHSGYLVLIAALAATMVPIATLILSVESPEWWALALAGGGALLLAAVSVGAVSGNRPSSGPTPATAAPAPPPMDHPGGPTPPPAGPPVDPTPPDVPPGQAGPASPTAPDQGFRDAPTAPPSPAAPAPPPTPEAAPGDPGDLNDAGDPGDPSDPRPGPTT